MSPERTLPTDEKDFSIHGSESWKEIFGEGILPSPVRFVVLNTHSFPIFEDFLPEYLAEEKILVSKIEGSPLFFYYRKMKERMAETQFDVRVDRVPDVKDQWEVWVPDFENPTVPAALGVYFKEGETGVRSRDKKILPINARVLIIGVPFIDRSDTQLFPIEGITLANPFERSLSSGEETKFQIIGIGSQR